MITEFTDATSLETMNLCSEWLGNKSTAARETLLSVYRAPEIVLGWKHEYKVDCWGFGLVLHFMIFGKVRMRCGPLLPCTVADNWFHSIQRPLRKIRIRAGEMIGNIVICMKRMICLLMSRQTFQEQWITKK